MFKVEKVILLLVLVSLCCRAQEPFNAIPCGRNIYDERNLDVPLNLLGKHPWAASYGLLEGGKWKHQVSISCTFYEQLLRRYSCAKNFLCWQFGFVIFRCKNIGANAAYKMLMKLMAGVNFINILRTVFFNESVLNSFSVLTA